MCRVAEVETIRSILTWLKQAGIAPEDAAFDERSLDAFRVEVNKAFTMPRSSVTPVMERLLYVLSAVRQPQRVIGLGTYYGYALIWAVGTSCGPTRTYEAERIVGIDIDKEATERARGNVGRLAYTDHVELVADDGLAAIERLEGPFDLVYLDVESRELGKGLYLPLLQVLYDKIEEGGWVSAHDTTVPPFAEELRAYLTYVRNGSSFRESISLDVDPYGLELSIK